MADQEHDTPTLPDDFRQSAAPAAPADRRETVTLDVDADVLDWMRSASPNWRSQINDMLRSCYDAAINREAACDPDAFEPGEMVVDVPPEPEFA